MSYVLSIHFFHSIAPPLFDAAEIQYRPLWPHLSCGLDRASRASCLGLTRCWRDGIRTEHFTNNDGTRINLTKPRLVLRYIRLSYLIASPEINGHFRNLHWKYLPYVCIYKYMCVYVEYVCMYVWMDGWMYGCMDVWMYGCMDGWMYGWMDVWMYGCMDVWMDGCMDVWMYGCMDVWMDGCIHIYIYIYMYIYIYIWPI